MAITDLSILKTELPEVFQDQKIPEAWQEDWVVVSVPNQEREKLTPLYYSLEELKSGKPFVSPDSHN